MPASGTSGGNRVNSNGIAGAGAGAGAGARGNQSPNTAQLQNPGVNNSVVSPVIQARAKAPMNRNNNLYLDMDKRAL